jgi:putative transposase
VVTPEQRRAAVTFATETAGISERRACRLTGFAHSSQRYRTQRAPDAFLSAETLPRATRQT